MYVLYVAPNSYAMTVHALLEDIGADYEPRWVSIFVDNPDPDFLKASPHARVPALQHDGGSLCETGAIAWYLCERFPAAKLQVPLESPRRGAFLQWFHYFATTLQPEVMLQFHPELYFADPIHQCQLRQASMGRLSRVLATLERALQPGPFFMGEQRTLLDYLFAMQAVWPEIYPGRIEDYPNIHRLVMSITKRPAVAKVIEVHEARAGQAIWPLG